MLKKHVLSKFQLSECNTDEIGPKSKNGKPKNEKVCKGVGRALTLNLDFSVTHHESIAKKPFGNRLRLSRSKINYLK